MQDLDKWLRKNVDIIYSPFQEFLLSLHVLSKPDHHLNRYDWAKIQLENLPKEITNNIDYFRVITVDFLNLIDFVKPWDESANLSIEAGLEKINTSPISEWIYLLLAENYSLEQIELWLTGREDMAFNDLKPEFKELIKKPKYARKKLLDFLYHYLNHFLIEQKRIEPWLIKAVHEAQIELAEDPLRLLNRLHPRLVADQKSLIFQKAKIYQFYYQDIDRIFVIPSTFIEPHLLLGNYGQRISTGLPVAIPTHQQINRIPDDFIDMMKALSDKTRIGILKLLLDHPYCIQQLADIFHISEAAVSKHLKILKEMDLIWSERRGHYVFYKGIPERLEMLTVEIHQFMDMANPFQNKGGK